MIRSLKFGALLAVPAFVLTGCSSSDGGGGDRTFPVSVTDETGSEFFTVGAFASGESAEFDNHITIQVRVSNQNQIIINPVATIEFADGSTMDCEDEDLRHLPSLDAPSFSYDIPCEGEFPKDVDGATATVRDDYHE